MKYYTIKFKNGKKELIYGKWSNISKKVIGVKGVVYKSHKTLDSAEIWLNSNQVTQITAKTPRKRGVVYIYVDGSFYNGQIGWGWVAVKNNKKIAEDYGFVSPRKGRNIVGELQSAIQAVKWGLVKNKLNHIVIVHDYIGISSWPLGYWNAKTNLAKNYTKWMQKFIKNITFEKCSGHSGIKWNDYADVLARKALI